MNRILQPIVKRLRARRLGAFGVAAMLGCGMVSAEAARAIIAAEPAPVAATVATAGYEAQDHFPGAALLYVADEDAAPGAGSTGTTALPNLPLPPEAAALTADASIRPASPFSTRAASAVDRGRALQCLTEAIYYEAASESDEGQQAVAQVILNRVRHPAFPATVCGVVYQGSERATGCQFSYACDGAMARLPAPAAWARAMRVAAFALAGRVYAPVGLATHYHTYAVTPAWNRSLVMTAAIGAHFFHRWQGYWGTAGAFHQAYAGGEPVPGPHAKLALPVVTIASVAPIAPAPKTPTAFIQPAYAQSGTARLANVSATLPAQSQILDRWKDSGKPLR